MAAKRRHVSHNTVYQQVNRCRRELARFYTAIMQKPPPKDLLIENIRHKGYRLDPLVRIVRRDQLRARG